jgi:hypothetical protein
MSTAPDPKEKGGNPDKVKETEEIGGLFAGIKKIVAWVKKTVRTIISPFWKPSDHPAEKQLKHAPLSPDLSLKLESQKKKILDDTAALLKSEVVKDKADKKIIEGAKAFVENPTDNLEEITKHTTNVGHVFGEYEMRGESAPPAVDALHGHLLALLCVNRMSFVEKELEKGSYDLPEIRYAMSMAKDRATHLHRGYKDTTFIDAVDKLQASLDADK